MSSDFSTENMVDHALHSRLTINCILLHIRIYLFIRFFVYVCIYLFPGFNIFQVLQKFMFCQRFEVENIGIIVNSSQNDNCLY